jgi:hypothetical protein
LILPLPTREERSDGFRCISDSREASDCLAARVKHDEARRIAANIAKLPERSDVRF